jgi:hypothetical protein
MPRYSVDVDPVIRNSTINTGGNVTREGKRQLCILLEPESHAAVAKFAIDLDMKMQSLVVLALNNLLAAYGLPESIVGTEGRPRGLRKRARP